MSKFVDNRAYGVLVRFLYKFEVFDKYGFFEIARATCLAERFEHIARKDRTMVRECADCKYVGGVLAVVLRDGIVGEQ